LINELAGAPLRALGFGFIEMSRNDWDNQFGSDLKVLEQALDESAMNFTFFGAVAIKDP
jgi:hypothetical protein